MHRESFNSVLNSKFNLLGLCVLSGLPTVVQLAFETFGYQSYLFRRVTDPISIALKMDNPAVLDVLADHLSNSGDLESEVSQSVFLAGMKCSSKKFRELVIELAFPESKTYGANIQNVFPGEADKDFHRVIDTNSISKDLSFESKFTRIFDNEWSSSFVKVDFKVIPFRFDFSFSSNFMTQILEIMESGDDDLVMSPVRYLVRE